MYPEKIAKIMEAESKQQELKTYLKRVEQAAEKIRYKVDGASAETVDEWIMYAKSALVRLEIIAEK